MTQSVRPTLRPLISYGTQPLCKPRLCSSLGLQSDDITPACGQGTFEGGLWLRVLRVTLRVADIKFDLQASCDWNGNGERKSGELRARAFR